MVASLLASIPQGLPYEVILVDDASSDGTADWLAGLDVPRVRAVLNPQKLGYAASNNRGVAEAKGCILGLLNNDLVLRPGWLQPMLEVLNDPALGGGLVGNVQHRVSDGSLDHAGIRLNLHGQFEHVHQIPSDRATSAVRWVTGACVLIRRDLFLSLGGFDTRYRNGCEDFDLCFKVRRAGKKVMMAYTSQVQHHVSLSRGKVSGQNERNSRLLLQTWHAEIKQALAEVWAAELGKAPAAALPALDGELSADLLQTPHAAGRMLADQRLALQHQRWARLLDGVDEHQHIGQGVRVLWPNDSSGPNTSGAWPLRLELTDCKALEAIHLCGKVSRHLPPGQLGITIGCNGLHTKRFPLEAGQSFNLPFLRPLLLPLNRNILTISLVWQGNADAAEALAAVKLTHVVLDGSVVPIDE